MNDLTTILNDHTKKYQIPLNHLEHRYIQQCTDGSELERIYKELIGGQQGSHTMLEELTLDRIRNILPNSQILRSDRSTTSVINNQHKNSSTPKTNEEWTKFEENISREFNSDDEIDSNKCLHIAEQYRLNADKAFKLNNYQQSIDLYTNSLKIEDNISAYMNRAIAFYKLNKFDAAIQDCFDILLMDSKYILALSHRARCYLAKNQYDQANHDLDHILTIDPDNNEAQDLLNTLLAHQTTGDNEEIDIQPPIITLNIKEKYVTNRSTFDDDDDTALEDETSGTGLVGNLSDEEERVSRSINVSPTIDEDSDTQELITQKPLTNSIDDNIAFQNTKLNHQINDDENDLYDYNNHNYSSSNKQNNNEISSINNIISNSNFGSIIQSWLHDLIASQSHQHYHDRPWSKSSRPWSLDKIQHDIERFKQYNDYKNTIDVSKKMLQNGILDYHYYAEYITDTLSICAESYLKLSDYLHAIQYASEALQYNKNDGYILMYRAKAFENEKFLLFSYADYVRVPPSNFKYYLTQRACEKLIIELNSIENETWQEKLPNDKNDDQRYLIYLKQKTNYSEENSYEWYQTYADQLYLDACFVLAIRFYTYCIELQPHITNIYLKRAACYVKVFEPQKVLDDCDVVLKEDKNNLLALYYKASAYKMSREHRLYELTLKEYIKLQPNNQIILAEYHTYRHEQIPRKKRRIRTKSIDENNLSYDELEKIRLEKFNENLNNIKDQCSFILHLQSFDCLTIKLIEIIINTSRLMIQIEENYQQEHKLIILPFSYIEFCFKILNQLTILPEIDSILSMIDENYRILLDDLISYYSSRFNDGEILNRLKKKL